MQLTSDELLDQVRQDWPTQLEISRLRRLVYRLETENEELKAAQPSSYTGSAPLPYPTLGGEDGRHGG